jgi:hypothetical protein
MDGVSSAEIEDQGGGDRTAAEAMRRANAGRGLRRQFSYFGLAGEVGLPACRRNARVRREVRWTPVTRIKRKRSEP